MKQDMKKICIVGASGKLGRYMVQQALDRGYEVVGVCREKSVAKLDDFKNRITIIPGATNDREVIKRAASGRAGPEISQCSEGMALAVGVSAGKPLEERKNGRRRTASRSRIDHPEGGERRREKCGTGQTCHMPYLSTFVCHTAPGKRLRHPDSAGTPGAQGREDHHDLHPCPQPGR